MLRGESCRRGWEWGEEEGRKERGGVIMGVTHVQYMCKGRGVVEG